MTQQSRFNQVGGIDGVGHSSVQAWSAGDLFPGVIARIEKEVKVFGEWSDNPATVTFTSFEMTYKGTIAYFATYEAAADRIRQHKLSDAFVASVEAARRAVAVPYYG
jgi:hypothetical protein